MMTVTPEAIRVVLRDGILPERAAERGGFVLAAEGSCVVVTVEGAPLAGTAMPVVPWLSQVEALWLLGQCELELREAGYGVARRGDALVVGTDLVDVLALSQDQEAVERGRHEIEMKGSAA